MTCKERNAEAQRAVIADPQLLDRLLASPPAIRAVQRSPYGGETFAPVERHNPAPDGPLELVAPAEFAGDDGDLRGDLVDSSGELTPKACAVAPDASLFRSSSADREWKRCQPGIRATIGPNGFHVEMDGDARGPHDRGLLTDVLAKLIGRKTVAGSLSLLAVMLDACKSKQPVVRLKGSRLLPDFNRVLRPSGSAVLVLPDLSREDGCFEVPADGSGTSGLLPGMDGPATHCPAWLLSLLDDGDAEHMFDAVRQGKCANRAPRHAPYLTRIFFGALAALAVPEHHTGRRHRIDTTTGDIASWLFPGRWKSQARDWKTFTRALVRLGTLRVPLRLKPGSEAPECAYLAQLVNCPAVPMAWHAGKARVPIDISVPPQTGPAIPVNFDRLREYGVQSGLLYRGYLSCLAAMHAGARHGRRQTRLIAAPVINEATGRPRCRKGGRVVRDKKGGLVANPGARYAPTWTDENAARFLAGVPYDDAVRKKNAPRLRYLRYEARQAMERLAADGVVDLEQLPDGRFRIFEPRRGESRRAGCGSPGTHDARGRGGGSPEQLRCR